MIQHERLTPPEHIYPVDEWKMIERQFEPRFLGQMETIFATANGYLGMRGNFEEGEPVSQNGTFINGFHETWPIVYGEDAYGFARVGQTMLNVTDSKIIRLYVDDEPFYLPTATLLHFERVLDMQAGTLNRDLVWEMPSGKQVSIKTRRLTSFEHRHVAAIRYEVSVLNATAPVVISSEMHYNVRLQAAHDDPRKARGFTERPLLPVKSYTRGQRLLLSHSARNSRMTLSCGVDHELDTACPVDARTTYGEDFAKVSFMINARPGEPIGLTKFITYHTSRRASADELCERAERALDRVAGVGFDGLLSGQRRFLDGFWRQSDIEFRGDPKVQQSLRWNLFQLCQATARAEGAGIGARGLTGQAYDGHYFWDAEIYVLPFLIYSQPRIARNMLEFRHSMLDKARERARQVGQKGALFPWRTINGEEASAYYAAGTAQYHINADIMYALHKYVAVTGDTELLHRGGAEMLVETARLWCDLGFFSPRAGGRFCIHCVTGPDEYATVVNNNTYTNLMARENLWFAARTVEALCEGHPDAYADLVDRTGVAMDEVAAWRRAADNMFIPFDERLGINPQDDDFLDRKVWDFANTPAENYPLLLHYHPLVIYRHQVVKQADIVLAMFLLGDQFSREEKKRNFDYYDPITTGDSSLSVSIQSILACELNYVDKAREYARYAAMMDLADIGGNVKDGAHIASIGGTWMAVIYGVAGMRDYDGRISFDPKIPERPIGVRFRLLIRGQVLEVDIDKKGVTYCLREGSELAITHRGQEIQLTLGRSCAMPIETSG